MLVPWLLIALFWGGILGGGGYLLVRFLRAYERRSLPPAQIGALEERVRTLEEANSRLEGEITQLAEAQRFTTELLSARDRGSDRALPDSTGDR